MRSPHAATARPPTTGEQPLLAAAREKSVIKTQPLGYEVEKAYQWVDFQIYFKVRSHFFFF